jgi:hypothetical protein
MENKENYEKIDINERVKEFWLKDVWKSNTKHIHNERIKETLIQIQKLVNILKPNKKFYLMTDGELVIKSDPKIESQIEKLKRENINYIKTHVDSIPEYHKMIIEIKKERLFLTPDI